MRVNTQAVDQMIHEVVRLLPAIPDAGQALVVQGGHAPISPEKAAATAIQVVRQLADDAGMSMDAVAAALQAGSLAGMNLERIDGFLASFPDAAAGEPDEVRQYVLNGMRASFVRELFDDAGSQRFVDRVVAMASDAVAQQVPAQRTALDVRTPRGDLVLSEGLVEGCVRGVAAACQQAGIETARGISMLYSGMASFASPQDAIERLVRERSPNLTPAELSASVGRVGDYLGQHARNLSQGLLDDMGRAWLEENEAQYIAEGREQYYAVADEDELEYDGDDEFYAVARDDGDVALIAAPETESLYLGDDFSMDR
ncbi:hypothetical protein [Geopseudomonas aromaticivorans]